MDNLFIFDLPTHLPNETPKEPELASESQNRVPVNIETGKQNQIDHRDEDEEDNNDHEETLPKTNGTIYIQGTNISLQTEEDIAKWIEERKRNWPTNKNIELKRQQKQKQEEEQQQQQKDIKNAKSDNKKRMNEDESSNGPTKKQKSICRFYQLNKKCKFGNKCKNLHEEPTNENPVTLSYNELTHYRKSVNGIPILVPKLYSNRTENTLVKKLSLFKHLVTRDHMTNENEKVIEFIRYLNDQGLIDHDVMK